MNKFNKVLIIGALTLLCLETQAQFSLTGGLNLSRFSTNSTIEGYTPGSVKPGFYMGINKGFEITEMLSVDAGLLLNFKGEKYEYFSTEYLNLIYFDVPVVAKVHFNLLGIDSYVGLGPYLGIGIMSTYYDSNGRSYSLIVSNANESAYQRFDYGLASTAGIRFGRVGLNISYTHGLPNVNQGLFLTQKNRVFSLGVSYYL